MMLKELTYHSDILNLFSDWNVSRGYRRIRLSKNGWRPDISFLTPDGLIVTYEIKYPKESFGGIRYSLVQALEAVICGFPSSVVIPYSKLGFLEKFLPFFPQIGIITYDTNTQMSIIREPTITPQNELIAKSMLGELKGFKESTGTPRRRVKSESPNAHIFSYTQIRNGKFVTIRGHLRKRRQKKSK